MSTPLPLPDPASPGLLSLGDVQRVLLDAHPGIAFLLDEAGSIRWINPAAAERLGHGLADLAGRPVAGSLVAEDTLAERAATWGGATGDTPAAPPDSRLFATGLARGWAAAPEPWTLRHRDGSPHLVTLALVPLHDAQNRATGVLAIEPARRAGDETPLRLAHHDSLTGLPNRAVLTDRAEMALQRATRQKSVLAVLLIEIVGFDAMCDERGRSVGDDVLRATASRLHFELRKTDTAVRLDAGQFAALLVDLRNAEEGLAVARKIRKSLSAKVNVGVAIIPLELRVGIAWFPDHGDQLLPLLQAAEAALSDVDEKTGEGVTPAATATTTTP